MAFSVDAWGPPPVMPVAPPVTTAAFQPPGVKPQLTPAQSVEPPLVTKWAPCIVPLVFHRY